MRRLILFLPIGVFAAVAIGLGFSLTNDPRVLPSMLVDRPVPQFKRPAVEPGGIHLSDEDLKGKVSLLNVFASWCTGCRYEHPFLMKLKEDGRIPVYGINWKDEPGAGAKFLQRLGDPYIKAGDDASGRLGIDMGVTGVPETYVVDREGRVRYRHTGPITEQIWTEILEPMLTDLEARG